jgi:cold shock CspA family protein/ribosome-associated translation inhibitor RaiA
MKVPISISYRDVEKTDPIDNLIREKAQKLEQVCDYITSCRVAVERPHSFVKNGNPYRIRIDITVPPQQEVVVSKEPGNNYKDDALSTVIRDAFVAARKQLKKLVALQRKEVKVHPEQEIRAIITKINKDAGFGYITTVGGREIYFHKNSVVNEDFEKLETGKGVRFSEEMGDKGPQASSIQIMD